MSRKRHVEDVRVESSHDMVCSQRHSPLNGAPQRPPGHIVISKITTSDKSATSNRQIEIVPEHTLTGCCGMETHQRRDETSFTPNSGQAVLTFLLSYKKHGVSDITTMGSRKRTLRKRVLTWWSTRGRPQPRPPPRQSRTRQYANLCQRMACPGIRVEGGNGRQLILDAPCPASNSRTNPSACGLRDDQERRHTILYLVLNRCC
jgi:hypothetical protein